jgi:hypothetical protein
VILGISPERRGSDEVRVDGPGPIEGVTFGMPGSQLKMILSEPLHEKTYPLPARAAPTYHYLTFVSISLANLATPWPTLTTLMKFSNESVSQFYLRSHLLLCVESPEE